MTKKNNSVSKNAGGKSEAEFVLDQEVYANVSRAAKLHEVQLCSSQFSAKLDLFQDVETLSQMSHRYLGKCEELSLDDEGDAVAGRFSWLAEIKSGRKVGLKLSAEYFILYSGFEGLDTEHACFFVQRLGRFVSYPYFRTLFAHHASDAGLLLPPLPVLKERTD